MQLFINIKWSTISVASTIASPDTCLLRCGECCDHLDFGLYFITGDDVVPYKFGEKSSRVLVSTGFQDVTFKAYNGLGHYTNPEEMNEVCAWLTSKLGLGGRSP